MTPVSLFKIASRFQRLDVDAARLLGRPAAQLAI
jgi:hypothetical protein